MPYGPGTYGSKVGRPAGRRPSAGPQAPRPKKKKESAREKAIRLGGQKGRFSKVIGKMMTGKASPHTSRDESQIGKLIREAQKYLNQMKKVPGTAKKKKG